MRRLKDKLKDKLKEVKSLMKKMGKKFKIIKIKKVRINVSYLLMLSNFIIIIALVMQIISNNYQLRLLNNQLSYMQDTDNTMQAQIENMHRKNAIRQLQIYDNLSNQESNDIDKTQEALKIFKK